MEQIKQLREARGLTQKELATRIGVERTVLTHWELGHTDPRCEMLPRLADALGCTIDALFGREQKEDSA